ncbi:MAG TPA: M20 family metallopeptidase [Dehalococcoidia bacterium]
MPGTAEAAALKQAVAREVDAQRRDLVELSLRIHANPELGFQEHQASAWLADYLEARGFAVERGICGLPTAFRAEAGREGPSVAFLAEYDALPGIGHGCGHNIIAASAVGAGVATARVLERTGGRVLVIGTPAEEIYGGKCYLVERGAFAGVDAAMLTHPGSRNWAFARSLACVEVTVEYTGRAAHAAARPEEGINALDALVLAYGGIAALRQHIREGARIHGIITEGGQAPNVVPERAAGTFLVRAEDDAYLDQLLERVLGCFRAGAEATGARLEYRVSPARYAAMRTNGPLAEAYARNLRALGRELTEPEGRSMGSTDMGNVSAVVPAIHPSIAIAPAGTPGHSAAFAEAACGEGGHAGLLDAARAMAMTAVDFLTDAGLRAAVRAAFEGRDAP